MSTWQKLVLLLAVVVFIAAGWWRSRSTPPPPPATPMALSPEQAEERWITGIREARTRRSELMDEMEALLTVEVREKSGDVIQLEVTDLSGRGLAGFEGLVHLRDSEGERLCTLALRDSQSVPAGETVTASYRVGEAFRGDQTGVGEMTQSWQPFRVELGDTTEFIRAWPSQTWWPWCFAELEPVENG